MSTFSFLPYTVARALAGEFGTPLYVYDQKTLEHQARTVLEFPNAFGLTARYAVKASPSAAVIRALADAGLHMDASSGYEAARILRAGVPGERIQITSQQAPENLRELVEQGVLFNACSRSQIRAFGEQFPGRELSIRVNPGLGSGHSNRTNVGGPSSSFGIWHEHLDEAMETARGYGLHVTRLHTHIGSGSDPAVWQRVALLSLEICSRLPEVGVLNLGGGFKIGRMPGEAGTDLQQVGRPIVEAFRAFADRHGRKLHLEVEPGTFLVANAGILVAKAVDVVDTGNEGYRFIKLDTGMTEILRPSLYGAQHPIEVVPAAPEDRPEHDYIVVGHCCESGDVLTPAPGNPEGLLPRRLPETRIGDLVLIGGAGAYCAGMSSKNYNSFPEAAEVLLTRSGEPSLIRKRQTLDQILQNEILPPFFQR